MLNKDQLKETADHLYNYMVYIRANETNKVEMKSRIEDIFKIYRFIMDDINARCLDMIAKDLLR